MRAGLGLLELLEWPPVLLARLLGHRNLWWLLGHRWTRLTCAWLVTVGTACLVLWNSWTFFNCGRRDGNNGHVLIDFGGQYTMARMLVEGHGRHLYNRVVQREVLTVAFPVRDEEPDQGTHDADRMLVWFMGSDDPQAAAAVGSLLLPLGTSTTDPVALMTLLGYQNAYLHPGPFEPPANVIAPLAADTPLAALVLAAQSSFKARSDPLAEAAAPQIGGPLYPPVHPLLFWPLGLLTAQHAYRVNQLLGILFAFLAGLGLSRLSDGRLWWSVATLLVLIFPGYYGSLCLGQNATLTLTLLVWGWVLISTGRPGWGGVAWGLLAFKPVWAVAFLLVPIATRRWRVCLTMAATGAGLALLTLPLVGVQTWLDWLHVGREATQLYNADENWTFLSRDLLSIPRRWLLDFQQPNWKRAAHVPAAIIGWGIVLFVLEATVRLLVCRWREAARALTGPAAAFLFFSAWMSCFHFMYYDILLTALPVALLLATPRDFIRPRLLAVLPLPERFEPKLTAPYRAGQTEVVLPSEGPLTLLPLTGRHLVVFNSPTLTLLALLLLIEHVFPTMGLGASFSAEAFGRLGLQQPVKLSWKIHGTPWDTFGVMVLWLWSGWLWLWTPQRDA